MGHAAARRSRTSITLIVLGGGAGTLVAAVGLLVLAVLAGAPTAGAGCALRSPSVTLAPAAGGREVGASEYGGPGDPSSGTVGASGVDLLRHPDSFAELGGVTFTSADAMGGLPYMTPVRVSWGGHSAIAYKRDFGLGGAPVDGLPRVIDLWWQFAGALAIPYVSGRWSGTVRVSRPLASGAGGVLGQTPATVPAGAGPG
ncbi:MAG: hypothetical protein WBQ18_20530, partial [Solirubrobacteraceae bacterium]